MKARATEALPYIVSALFLLVVAVYYAQFLNMGPLGHYDEYYTLERTTSVLTHNDWTTVYSNHLPTFKKPPLQYWMGAAFMEAGLNPELAVRLPSFIFGGGVLILTGLLAYVLLPDRPWVAPFAILLLATSLAFWSHAISALLELGAVFFATLALVGSLLAVKKPGWWYLAAAACVLGALQKAPIAIAFAAAPIVGEVLAQRMAGAPRPAFLRSRPFKISLAIVVAGLLLWPAVQYAKYGARSLREAYVQQMVSRFTPFVDVGPGTARFNLYTLVTDGEPFLRLVGVLALFLLPIVTKRRELWALPAMFAIYAVMMAAAGGFVAPRYTLLFLPMLMASLAVVIASVVTRPALQLATVVAVSVVGAGPFKSTLALTPTGMDMGPYVPFLRRIAGSIQQDETLVECATIDREKRLFPGAVSYYASGGKPYNSLRSVGDLERLARSGIRPPYRGVCTDERFNEMASRLVNPQVVETFRGFTHWRADGVK
jgi:4-amino-4-deoxy-L-arabinose transferase-like glycosyltransferase